MATQPANPFVPDPAASPAFCRVCGCREYDACVDDEGGACAWIEAPAWYGPMRGGDILAGLCSACDGLDPVAERVHGLIAQQLGWEVGSFAARCALEADLAADSFDLVVLATAIEDEFGLDGFPVIGARWTVGRLVKTAARQKGNDRV